MKTITKENSTTSTGIGKARDLLLPSGIFCAVLLSAGATYGATTFAVEDSYIHRGNPTTNYGTATTMQIKNDINNGFARKAYMKFDLTGLNADLTGSATLRVILAENAGTSFTVDAFGLKSGTTGYDWSETGITWNNAPANITNSASNFVVADTAALQTGITVANATAAGTGFDFTFSSLGDYLQADNTVTLMLRVSVQVDRNPWLSFASSENATYSGPQLTYAVVPEPSAALLGGLGLLALLRRRR